MGGWVGVSHMIRWRCIYLPIYLSICLPGKKPQARTHRRSGRRRGRSRRGARGRPPGGCRTRGRGRRCWRRRAGRAWWRWWLGRRRGRRARCRGRGRGRSGSRACYFFWGGGGWVGVVSGVRLGQGTGGEARAGLETRQSYRRPIRSPSQPPRRVAGACTAVAMVREEKSASVETPLLRRREGRPHPTTITCYRRVFDSVGVYGVEYQRPSSSLSFGPQHFITRPPPSPISPTHPPARARRGTARTAPRACSRAARGTP